MDCSYACAEFGGSEWRRFLVVSTHSNKLTNPIQIAQSATVWAMVLIGHINRPIDTAASPVAASTCVMQPPDERPYWASMDGLTRMLRKSTSSSP